MSAYAGTTLHSVVRRLAKRRKPAYMKIAASTGFGSTMFARNSIRQGRPSRIGAWGKFKRSDNIAVDASTPISIDFQMVSVSSLCS